MLVSTLDLEVSEVDEAVAEVVLDLEDPAKEVPVHHLEEDVKAIGDVQIRLVITTIFHGELNVIVAKNLDRLVKVVVMGQ